MLSLSFVRRRRELRSWISSNRNLVLLRKRLKKEMPRRYLRGFYRTWVYSHILARLALREQAPGVPAPLTIKVSPTLRCNLECKGCFAANYPSRASLPLDAMERLVKQAAHLGVRSIGVIGGEPLLLPEVFDLFRGFPSTGFYLVTNGTLVSDQVIEALRALHNVVTIFSIEGFEETTDDLRGEGVFAKVVAAMGRMKEARLIFGFSTVVHRENVAEVVSDEFIDFMTDNGCCFGGFLPYIPVGSAPRYGVVCGEAEVKGYYRRIDEVTRGKPILVLKEGYSDGSFLNQGCGAGNTIHVTSNGEAEPCNGIEFFTHSIHDSSLKDILRSDFFTDIRALHRPSGKRCLVITEPRAVLRVVKKHNAVATHEHALMHLEEYAAQNPELA